MESELDRVEDGEIQWQALLGEFYPPFQDQLQQGESRSEEIIKEICVQTPPFLGPANDVRGTKVV